MAVRRQSRIRGFFRRHRSAVSTILTIVAALGFFVAGTILFWFLSLDIPSIDNFENRRVAESTKIYDRTGDVLLYDVHGEARRTVVELEDVSPHIPQAVVAIEDAEFYGHHGVRPMAIVRAVITNIRNGELLGGQGGSTLTQQVIKNTVLSTEKTITRKVKEWVLALKIEQQLEKDEIIEIYLNEMPWGGTVYGIEEASIYYFGKPASDISIPEAAYLAALPQAPTYYSPYGNNRDALERRKERVLFEMNDHGFVSDEEYEEALNTEVDFVDREGTGLKAPHFVFYVREYLEEEYGVRAVMEGGLTVITTLDYDLQEEAERIVDEYATRNEQRFNAENAALVATDPNTGHILTMVGSRDWYEDDSLDGKYNAAVALRQPGSAFKPFAYATAFEKGFTPETVLFDLKTQFSTACEPNNLTSDDPCYSPSNYDNAFRGPLSLRNALAQSVNIPSVKLLHLAGLQDALDTAVAMGISTLETAGRYGLTLVLGGGEVRLLDIVNAYGTFATEGTHYPHTAILSIEDGQGEVLEEYEEEDGDRILDTNTARLISNILSDNEARAPLYGLESPMYFPNHDVAAKTGTTNDNRDAWVIGYTPNIAAGAWAGNNIPESMNQISGLIVTPLWREFMDIALENEKYTGSFTEPTPTPDDIKPILRGEWNPGNGSLTDVHTILHYVSRSDPRGQAPTVPAQDSQYTRWEYAVRLWAGDEEEPEAGDNISGQYEEEEDVDENGGEFYISSPVEGSAVASGDLVVLQVEHPNPDSVSRVSYYVDGIFIGSTTREPFSISTILDTLGDIEIRAVSDGSSGTQAATVTISVQ